MKYLFRAHTTEGYTIKILSEILNYFYRMICFEISPRGIHVMEVDTDFRILIDAFLDKINFRNYKCEGTHIVPINTQDFYLSFKPIRKKDPITLFISEDNTGSLGILSVPPSDPSRKSTTNLRILRERRSKPHFKETYTVQPINIPGKSYARMCKELKKTNRVISILREGEHITFSGSKNDLIERKIEFDMRDDDDSSDMSSFNQEFDAGYIIRLDKIANFDNKMVHIYAEQGMPLHIAMDLGNIGVIKIYVRSIQQINKLQNVHSDSDSDDYEEYSDYSD
jgi:hypothetical protein